MELLKRLVLDEGKIVTATYLLNQTSLDAMKIQSLFNEFLKNHDVDATYYLVGKLESGGKQCLIVKKEDLENAKKKFEKISICNVYSVQKNSIKDLDSLFNVNWQENHTTTKMRIGKTYIRCAKAENSYQKWLSRERVLTLANDVDQQQHHTEIKTEFNAPVTDKTVQTRGKASSNKVEAKKLTKTQQTKISNFFTTK